MTFLEVLIMIPSDSNIINVTSNLEKDGNITIKSSQTYYKLPFYCKKFYDEKQFTTFVKAVEKLVRRSNEYSAYVGHLKKLGLNKCAFYNNVDDERATIEFHHYPFTLYDIVTIVTENRFMNKKPVSTFLVAQEVMNLHFQNLIGLVPLSKTVHKLVHAGEIFVNINMVYGYVDEFVNRYEDAIPIELALNYNEILKMSKADKKYSDKDILKYNPDNP
jgi:hypothetical protein